jgi:ribosomal protein L34E
MQWQLKLQHCAKCENPGYGIKTVTELHQNNINQTIKIPTSFLGIILSHSSVK